MRTTQDIPIIQPDDETSQPPLSLRGVLFGGIGFMVFLTLVTVGIQAIGVERLQGLIEDAGWLAPLIYILIKAATFIFAPLTSGPIQVAAGTLFGNVWLGTLYTLIGETIGGVVNFLIARRLGRPVVVRFIGNDGIRKIESFYQNRLNGWVALAIARVVLFAAWDFLSYAAGLTKSVRLVTYTLVSAIFGVIPVAFFVWLGKQAIEDTSTLYLIYGLVAAVILIPILGRKTISKLWHRVMSQADDLTA